MFCDKILYYVHMTLVTSMMKWCLTFVPWRFWITFHFSNEILDYIQLATKTSYVYWHVTIIVW